MADPFLGGNDRCKIAFFVYRDLDADLFGSGLVIVSFEIGGEVAAGSPMPFLNDRHAHQEEMTSSSPP